MSLFQDLGVSWLQRRPYAMRLLFGTLQRVRPLPAFGRTVIVTRADDAREVFARPADFEIGPLNARKMLFGPFLLGLDLCPRYRSEHAVLQSELEISQELFAETAQSVTAEVASELGAKLEAAHGASRLEIVTEYAERVTTLVASRFFGVPAEAAQSEVFSVPPGIDVLRMWLRKLGSVIATNSPAPFGLQEVAEACTPEFVSHVNKVLQDVKQKPDFEAHGLLGRFAELQRAGQTQISDEWIVRNVIGLMLAGSAAITKGFTHALDQLLRRPRELRAAVELARGTDTDEELLGMVREALRFNPVFPLLPRFCPRGATLAAGTPRQLEVPAGATVFVATVAAMFDGEQVLEPDRFGYGRDDAATYLHFGDGQHVCLGKKHAEAELLQMFRCFLALPGIHNVAPGRLLYDGPAIDRYVLSWPKQSSQVSSARPSGESSQ